MGLVFFNNFIYFQLCWVFTAVLQISLAAEKNGAALQSRCTLPSPCSGPSGFRPGSRLHGLQQWRFQAPAPGSAAVARGLSCSMHEESSRTRGQPRGPASAGGCLSTVLPGNTSFNGFKVVKEKGFECQFLKSEWSFRCENINILTHTSLKNVAIH